MSAVTYVDPKTHTFKGPSGVTMYRAKFTLKSKKGKAFALVQEFSSVGSAQAHLGMRFGHGEVEVFSVEPVGRNPEFTGCKLTMVEYEEIVREQYLSGPRRSEEKAWLEAKAKEMMHGDEISRAAGAKPAKARTASHKGRKGY